MTKSPMLRRWIPLALTALVLAAALAYALRPAPVPVSLARVTRGPLAVTVEEEGRTRVVERYDVSAPVAGWAPRIELDPGDRVQAGETLVALQPTPVAALDPRARAEAEAGIQRARAALEADQARLEAAQAAANYARSEYRRLSGLRVDGQVSRSEVERAQADATRAGAELRSARYAVDMAREDLRAARARLEYAGQSDTPDRVPVKAPVDGEVLAVQHESQGVVTAGEPLLTIGNPRSLEVVVDVLSADAVRIHPGMEVRFHRWGGDEPLEGRVRRVEPSGFTKISALGVEEQRVRVIADISAPYEQWQGLGDAYRVEAEFILWSSPEVLQVPGTAVFRTPDDGHAVFVATGGVAHRRSIKTGHAGGLAVEVLKGLQAGEQVVLQPGNEVTDGIRITRLQPR